MSEIVNPYRFGAGNITAGLVGWWKFDEGSGASAADSSGSGLTGTLVNTPTWVAGKINSALDFDAADGDYVTLGAGLNMGSGDFTMAAWINRDSIAGVRGIIGTGNPGAAGFNVYQDGGGLPYLYLGDKAVTDMGLSPALTITAGTWYHAAVVMNRTAASVTFYLNGVASASTIPYVSLAFTAATDRIGSFGSGEMFDGKIDDARIYNRALSADDISALYAWR